MSMDLVPKLIGENPMRKTLSDDSFLNELTRLFLAEGVNGLTIGDIAARLRCSRRRLYAIAQTKEEIFCTAVDHFFQCVLNEGQALSRKEPNLTAAIAAYLNVGVRAGRKMSVRFVKDMEESEPARIKFDDFQRARTIALAELIDEGVQQGVFVPCHGLLVAELILGAALRLRRPAFLAQAHLTIEEAFQELYRVLLGGLLVDASAPKKATASKKNKTQKDSVADTASLN